METKGRNNAAVVGGGWKRRISLKKFHLPQLIRLFYYAVQWEACYRRTYFVSRTRSWSRFKNTGKNLITKKWMVGVICLVIISGSFFSAFRARGLLRNYKFETGHNTGCNQFSLQLIKEQINVVEAILKHTIIFAHWFLFAWFYICSHFPSKYPLNTGSFWMSHWNHVPLRT